MRTHKNFLFIRVGNPRNREIKHPVHHPAPLVLKYAQTILQNNFTCQTHLLDYWVDPLSFEELSERMDEWSIDTVIVSISSPCAEAGVKLCAQLREHKNVFIVLVGSDVSEKYQYYQSLNSIFDVMIRGEYELELTELFKRLSNTADRDSVLEYYNVERCKELLLIDNLDDLPTINWTRDELKKYPYIYPLRYNRRTFSGYISTSRGCPHACTFCSPTVRKSFGRRLRLRSPQRVVDDIEQLIQQGLNVVSFEDDDFTLNKEHVTQICQEIQRRKLRFKWACHARVDEVEPEILRTMKQAGCALLLFGIESGSQRIVNVLHKASMKNGWRERATRAVQEVRRAGIASCAMFIVGSPTETIDDVEQSIDLAHQMNPDMIKVHFFTLYPGSVDYRKYHERSGEVLAPHHYQKPIVNLSDMDITSLKKLQRKFYRKFLFRPAFCLSHLYNYLPYYISNFPSSMKLVFSGLLFLVWGQHGKRVTIKPAPNPLKLSTKVE